MKLILFFLITFFCSKVLALNIVLLGSDKRVELLESWAKTNSKEAVHSSNVVSVILDDGDLIVSTPAVGTSLVETANLLYKNEAAYIVVDATSGLLPIDRDHIIISRQSRTPIIGAILTDKIHEQNILNSHRSEIIQLLATYEMGDNTTPIYVDSKLENRLSGVSGYGLNHIFKSSQSAQIKRNPAINIVNTNSAYSHYYLLSQVEAMHKAISIDKPTRLTLWSEGSASEITAIPKVNAGPGGNAQVILRSEYPFRTGINSRNFILLNGKLVGVGVVTKILR